MDYISPSIEMVGKNHFDINNKDKLKTYNWNIITVSKVVTSVIEIIMPVMDKN